MLIFQDLDGEDEPTPAVFDIEENVAKLLIRKLYQMVLTRKTKTCQSLTEKRTHLDDVRNLCIKCHGGLVTTLEIFNATNLTLQLNQPTYPNRDSSDSSTAVSDDDQTAYGTVTLDPYLHAVRISYASPELINAIIFTSSTSAVPERVRDVVLAVTTGENTTELQIADQRSLVGGVDRQETADDKGQFHIVWDSQGWKIKPLQRNEKNYPALGKNG